MDPFTPETRSMLGSLTKAFTATTIGELVAEGKMDWDTTAVNIYMPDFETIDPSLTSQQVEFDPKLRATTNYNNAMYDVAGEAAAKVAGVPIEKLVHDKILKPLGLSNSGFSNGELKTSLNFALPSWTIRSMTPRLDDSSSWGQVVLTEGKVKGEQVLSKEGIAATLTCHTTYQAAIRDPEIFPNADLVVAVLASADVTALTTFLPLHIADEFLSLRKTKDWLSVNAVETTAALYELVAESTKGDSPERVPTQPAAHKLSAYAGEYVHPGYGTTTVHMKGGKLHIALGGFHGCAHPRPL
ncbi:hypothetical protein BGZ82_008633 [Podila clonocystis]|nr:hypothetical protein BGZ82_008633 [Podila clonocystis]